MSRRRDGNLGALSLGMGQAHAEYRAARASKARSRARGINAMGSNADYHYRSDADYLRIIELARDCDRNDQIVGQGVNRLVDLVFRDGMMADPNTGNTDLDQLIAETWRTWGDNRDHCDISGKFSLHSMARMAFRHSVVDGDAAILLLDSGHLEFVEGHRLRTPNSVRNDRRKLKVVHGIEMDAFRRPVNYWFTRDSVGLDMVVDKVGDVVKVPAYDSEGNRNVLHIFRPERVSQSRGVSALARVLETAGQHDDLQWAQLVKAQVSACFTIFRERAAGTKLPSGSAPLGAQTDEVSPIDGFTKTLEQLAPGMILEGREGEKLHGFAPNTPNAEFFNHSRLILTFIAVNLGIPAIVLMLDPSATNFSGWRGAMDAAKPGLNRFRQQMVEQFYRPVYEWMVRRLLDEHPEAATMAEAQGVNPLACLWKPPHDPYIEPSKDADADKTIITEGLNSRRNVLASRGLDIEVVDANRVQDQQRLILLAIEAAEAIREAHPMAGVSWRDLVPADTKSEQLIHVAQIEREAAEDAEDEAPEEDTEDAPDA